MKIVPIFKLVYGSMLVVLLLASFGLHALQVPHEHQEAGDHHHGHANNAQHSEGEESSAFWNLGEYMHAADKKLWLVLPAPLFACLSVLCALYGSWRLFMELIRRHIALVFWHKRFQLSIWRNYLSLFYSKGLYNPKLF